MEKFKKWVLPSFDDEEVITAKKQKTDELKQDESFTSEIDVNVKPNNNSANVSKTVLNTEDWMKQFEPKTVEDLAVHSKKIQEVESWLCKAIGCHGNMLVITGPVGCGKTATVEALAQKHNIRIREWITPHDTDLPSGDGKYEYKEKQANIFKKFLVDAGCYSSLLQNCNNHTLLLVEDFPNALLRNPSEFTDALQHYRDRRAKSPIVFICTECHSDSRDTAHNLFTSAIKQQFQIQHITFNSISATGLKMALKRVSQIMSKKYSSVYNSPPAELQECVANSSAGDVRSAVLNLHFASLKGMSMRPSEQSITKESKGKKSKKKVTSKFQAIGKDETVTLLHGVGRVLNPKLLEVGKRTRFTHPPAEIVEQFLSQPASFVNFLHENYLPHFGTVEHACRAAAILSDADVLLSEWRERFCQEYGLHIAVGGLMVANKSPVSAWNPVRGPKSNKITYLTPRDLPLLEEGQLYHGRVLISDYKTYCNIINSNKVEPGIVIH